MNTALSTRAYAILGLLAGSLALSGCGQRPTLGQMTAGPLAGHTTGDRLNGATLITTPRVLAGGYKAQAIVSPLTMTDIDHVTLSLFTLNNGFETAVTGPDGQPLEADVPASQLGDPVQFSELDFNTDYRIRAAAYSASSSSAADKISDDGGSYVDVNVTNDDRPILSTLPCQLDDVWFDGVATGVIDVIPGAVRYEGSPTIGVASASPSPQPTASPAPSPLMSPSPAPSGPDGVQ